MTLEPLVWSSSHLCFQGCPISAPNYSCSDWLSKPGIKCRFYFLRYTSWEMNLLRSLSHFYDWINPAILTKHPNNSSFVSHSKIQKKIHCPQEEHFAEVFSCWSSVFAKSFCLPPSHILQSLTDKYWLVLFQMNTPFPELGKTLFPLENGAALTEHSFIYFLLMLSNQFISDIWCNDTPLIANLQSFNALLKPMGENELVLRVLDCDIAAIHTLVSPFGRMNSFSPSLLAEL